MSGERPDPPGSVYVALLVCAALSLALSWPRQMTPAGSEREGFLFGIGSPACG